VFFLPEIAKRLQEISSEQIVLDIIGDGPDRAALRRKLAADGSGTGVTMLGAMAYQDMIERLPMYHVLLMPSLYEGLPLAMLAAMGAGVVPVVSDLGGIREAVTDHVNGRIVPTGDAAGFAAAVSEIVSE